MNVAFGFALKDAEDDDDSRPNDAHGNKTRMDCFKVVAAKECLLKFKNLLLNTVVIETRKSEQANTKWRFY